jgi:hypothetical protein
MLYVQLCLYGVYWTLSYHAIKVTETAFSKSCLTQSASQ